MTLIILKPKNEMSKGDLRLVTMNFLENGPLRTLSGLEQQIKNQYLPYNGFDFECVVLDAIRDWCGDQNVKTERTEHYSKI